MAELHERDSMICRACGREERASEGYPCSNCGTFICIICSFRGITLCSQCAGVPGGAVGGKAADAPNKPAGGAGPDHRRLTMARAAAPPASNSTSLDADAYSAAPADFTALGLAIGHASDETGATGLTVVRGIDGPFRAAAVVVGRASGSRELATLSPDHLVDRIDAILLTGGSAYGLDAAAGAMRWMEERGRGFPVGAGVVPIVPAAVVYDLAPLGRFDARPSPQMAYDACESATPARIPEGSIGAGTGTTVGKGLGTEHSMKGGIGCWTIGDGEVVVGAIAVVNAFGDVRGDDGEILAGARGASGFADTARLVASSSGGTAAAASPLTNTTLAVVAVNVPLARVQLRQLASAASAALYRRITPAGTTVDGDTVFAIGPAADPASAPAASPMKIEALAVRALEVAIERAVRLARGRGGIPGLADDDTTLGRGGAS